MQVATIRTYVERRARSKQGLTYAVLFVKPLVGLLRHDLFPPKSALRDFWGAVRQAVWV